MRYEQLENLLDDDLNWRKREVTELLFIAREKNSKVLLKSFILLLYAHWEGYIKKSSKLYLKYVVEKKILLNKLSPNFKAIALKGNISRSLESRDSLNLSRELEFIDRYLLLESKKFKIRVDPDNEFDSSIIDTNSNLNPKVLKSIYEILGVQYKEPIEIKENYIDRNLLHVRNTISHGSKYENRDHGDLVLQIEDINKLKNIIVSIIDNFRDELLEYAYKEYFLSENNDARNTYDQEKEMELARLINEE